MRELELERENDNLKAILAALANEYESHSSARASFLALVCRGSKELSPTALSRILEVSDRSMRRAVTRSDEDVNPLVCAQIWPHLSQKKRKTDDANETATRFWRDLCRQTQKRDNDGEQLNIFYYDTTVQEVFNSYWRTIALAAEMEETITETDNDDKLWKIFENECNNGRALRRSAFLARRPSNVRYGAVREHSCPTCRVGYENRGRLFELEKDENSDKDEIKKRKNEEIVFQEHLKVVRAQRALFNAITRDSEDLDDAQRLRNGEAMILMDFSPYSDTYVRLRSMSEAFATIQCLHVVTFKKQDDTITVHYADYFSHESNDIYFVRLVLFKHCEMLKKENFVVKSFFSDGGPKHFRNRRTIGFLLVELPFKIGFPYPPQWHYFAPNHGKSHCDARAATIKTFLKRVAIRGGKAVGVEGIVDTINNIRQQNLTHRNAHAIGDISHSEAFDWSAIDGIRQYNSLFWTRSVSKGTLAENTTKEAYEVCCKQCWNDSDNDAEMFYIEPLYNLNDGKKAESLIISKKERTAEKKSAKQNFKKKNSKAEGPEVDEFLDQDDEISNEIGLVGEEDTIVVDDINKKRLKQRGTRIAIALRDDDSGNAEVRWFAATVTNSKPVKVGYTKDKHGVHVDEYNYMLTVKMDDEKDHTFEKPFMFDEDVRLLKSNRC